MAKKSPKLKGKEAKLVAALVTNGDNVAAAGRKAGYAARQHAHRALANVQKKMPELMDEMGMTDRWLLAILKDGVEGEGCKAVKQGFDKGIYMGDGPPFVDKALRRDFIDMTLRVKGAYKQAEDAGNNIRPATLAVRVVVTDERRSARLARMLSDSGAAGVVVDVAARVD